MQVMKVHIWLLFTLLSATLLQAQSVEDSLKILSIRQLDESVEIIDFEVDDEGNILLLDGENHLLKCLASTNYDSCIVAGGTNIRTEGFLNPTKIVARNRQSVYILDQGMQRIALFNTNLKLTGETNFLQIENLADWLNVGESILPLSFDVNTAGEKFILNGQDNRVYRIGTFGSIAKAFGGIDYGEGSLYAPIDLQIRSNNDIWISDTSEQVLMIYNLYGIFQESIQPAVEFRWQAFHIEGNTLFLYDATRIYAYDIRTQQGKYLPPIRKTPLKALDLHGNTLYLLVGNEVHLLAF
jgi:hypothetical protein